MEGGRTEADTNEAMGMRVISHPAGAIRPFSPRFLYYNTTDTADLPSLHPPLIREPETHRAAESFELPDNAMLLAFVDYRLRIVFETVP